MDSESSEVAVDQLSSAPPPSLLLQLPMPILSEIVSLCTDDNDSRDLIKLSLVCKTFQAAVRAVSKVRIIPEKYGLFFTDGVRVANLAPLAEHIRIDGRPLGRTAMLLRRWSKVYGKTLKFFGSCDLRCDDLNALAEFTALETLKNFLIIQSEFLGIIQKDLQLPSIRNLDLVIDLDADKSVWQAFLDLFPNLTNLEIFTMRIQDSQFTVCHPKLEALEYSGYLYRSVVTIDCPNLKTLTIWTLPVEKLVIKSVGDLRSVCICRPDKDCPHDTGDELFLHPEIDVPFGLCGLLHFECGLRIGPNLIDAFFLPNMSSLETLAVHSTTPLTLIKDIVYSSRRSFKLLRLRELTVNGIDDDWKAPETPPGRLVPVITPEERQMKLNMQLSELKDWLWACPVLTAVRFRVCSRTPDTKYLYGFMAKARKLKELFPNVIVRCPWD